VDIWRAKASDVRRAKANVQFDPDITADKAKEEIVRLVKQHSVLLFIKGTRQAPQCGFTGACVALFSLSLFLNYRLLWCLAVFFHKKTGLTGVLLFFFSNKNRLYRFVFCSTGV
jgi:hypothetical protein